MGNIQLIWVGLTIFIAVYSYCLGNVHGTWNGYEKGYKDAINTFNSDEEE